MTDTVRATTAQALVRFLAAQQVSRDGSQGPFFAGVAGILGHGNVAGLGQALVEADHGVGPAMPYVLSRNEQGAVHMAVGYARHTDRLQTWAVTTSIGPGATNLVTGAALATTARIPVLLLPSDTFATRAAPPLLQELEHPAQGDVTVNDALRPVSRWFDRVQRPEQLVEALLRAMRVLTDPAETGAVTLALPQDVQGEVADWPDELFAPRVWRVRRAAPDPNDVGTAAALIRAARRPLIIAGGGVHYSGAEDELAELAAATGIPVAETQAGRGSLRHGHPRLMGAVGSTGTTAANALAREADLVLAVGSRLTDFTTASRSAFQCDQVRFVGLNVSAADAAKLSALAVTGDARSGLSALADALSGFRVDPAYVAEQERLWTEWDARVAETYAPPAEVTASLAPGVLTQGQVIGAVNERSGPRDVVVCAAGSMPGELHKLWRTRDRKGYHVEYAYSCMGYEIPAGIGVRMADDSRDVFVMVGDGSYLMLPGELVTAVQEKVKIIVVLVDNQGFASIGALSQELGSQRFGTAYRYRDDGEPGGALPVDLAANARSLGAAVIVVTDLDELHEAIARAKAAPSDGGPVVIHVCTDPTVPAPDSRSWWDVPVSAASGIPSTREAYARYVEHKRRQRHLLRPTPAEWPRGEEDS